MSGAASQTIVLVSPPRGGALPVSRSIEKPKFYAPLGLLSLAAVLESHGYDLVVIDLSLKADPVRLLSQALLGLATEPLAVGLSVCTEDALACARLQRLIRQVTPRATIILGGPHVTVCYREALANPETDVVVRGEGEATIVELLEALRSPGYGLRRVRGIAYRDSTGAVRCNPDRLPIARLDQLPIPAYHHAGELAATGVFSLVSSRGCPGRCVFCASHVASGPVFRAHSAEWMFSTIYSIHRRQPFGFLSILDDTFTADARRVHSFCAMIESWGVKLRWAIRTRVDVVGEDLLRRLAAAGCVEIHIGIESGDDGVLKAIGKNITLAAVKVAIARILGNGILLDASFILGHPGDTLETIERTVLLASAIREFANTVVMSVSTPFPGTAIYDRAAEFGIRILERDWSRYNSHVLVYEASAFTADDLSRANRFFMSQGFAAVPEVLLTGHAQTELRADLANWIAEMKALGRGVAKLPSADTMASEDRPSAQDRCDSAQ